MVWYPRASVRNIDVKAERLGFVYQTLRGHIVDRRGKIMRV